MNRVRVKSIYTYDPVLWDYMHPPLGAEKGILKKGDKVRVVNLPCCPKANTMGHCHIETMDGKFAGLVCTNSLTR